MRTPSGGARPLALVTGGTAGIGRVFADRLARRGYDLLLVARDGQRLAAVGRELSRLGISVDVIQADLSRDDDVARVVERIRTGNPLSLLVNNAGFGTKGLLSETPIEPQVAMLHLHVLAPMRLIQAALPGMLARRSGGVINVSSIAGFLFSPGSINYCASKAYLTVFTEGLATELAGSGIRVQALCPGFTRTEFHQRMAMDSAARKRRRLWLTAEYVVDTSLATLGRGGPVVCIPGVRYKLIAALLRLMPRWLLWYLLQKR
jgi:short-subunit dehydrogenase